jgi:hypothetical protein
MDDDPAGGTFAALTDIHAHPAMNAFLWDRDLRRHYWTGRTFDPLASLTDFMMAVIAVAVAVRSAGAPLSSAVLLGLSAIVANHPPPTGPLGLALFAAGVVLFYRSQRVGASRPAQTESPAPPSEART